MERTKLTVATARANAPFGGYLAKTVTSPWPSVTSRLGTSSAPTILLRCIAKTWSTKGPRIKPLRTSWGRVRIVMENLRSTYFFCHCINKLEISELEFCPLLMEIVILECLAVLITLEKLFEHDICCAIRRDIVWPSNVVRKKNKNERKIKIKIKKDIHDQRQCRLQWQCRARPHR